MTNFVFLKFNVQFSVGINLNRSSPAKRLKKVKKKNQCNKDDTFICIIAQLSYK